MDGEKKRLSGAAALLILLAIASFATAAITITNITEWKVIAKHPPIVKVAGTDAATNYVNVIWYTSTDGTNRTVISIIGFRGDITKYTDPLKICNKDTVNSYSVSLAYGEVVYGGWTYVKYLKFWLDNNGPLTVDVNGASGSANATIGPGNCVSVPVEVLVTWDAPTDIVLINVTINVVATKL